MKSQITYVTWRCTVVPPGEYDCIYYMRPEWLTIRHNDIIAVMLR